MKFIGRTFLGLITCLIISMLNSNFGQVMIVSIVCTMGIGLIVWVPLWWLIGFILVKLLDAYSLYNENQSKLLEKGVVVNRSSSSRKSQTRKPSNDEEALKSFIIEARKKSTPEAVIKKALLESGWDNAAIEKGFKTLDARES